MTSSLGCAFADYKYRLETSLEASLFATRREIEGSSRNEWLLTSCSWLCMGRCFYTFFLSWFSDLAFLVSMA